MTTVCHRPSLECEQLRCKAWEPGVCPGAQVTLASREGPKPAPLSSAVTQYNTILWADSPPLSLLWMAPPLLPSLHLSVSLSRCLLLFSIPYYSDWSSSLIPCHFLFLDAWSPWSFCFYSEIFVRLCVSVSVSLSVSLSTSLLLRVSFSYPSSALLNLSPPTSPRVSPT